MNTNTVLRFLGWASLTYMWLEANCMFFKAISDAINYHNEQIGKRQLLRPRMRVRWWLRL